MSRTLSLVQRVQIASPCPAKWDEMVGDDRSRFCSQCKLNVYNLTAMTEADGEALIIAKEGKLCARVYRRCDGTVLTKDCPVGLRAMRQRLIWIGSRAAAMLLFIVGVGMGIFARPRVPPTQGENPIFGFSANSPWDPPIAGTSPYGKIIQNIKRWIESTPPQTTTFVMGSAFPNEVANQINALFADDTRQQNSRGSDKAHSP